MPFKKATDEEYDRLKRLGYHDYRKAIATSEMICLNLKNKIDHSDAAMIERVIVLTFVELLERRL